MKLITKTILLVLLTSIFLFNNNSVQASSKVTLPADSTVKQREVLLSQQLFVVKLSKPKNKKAKPGIVDMKAELRDAFTIICYDKDKTTTELDWAMCPNGKCPVPGTYDFGSAKYKHLDTLIANTKLANIKAAKQMKALVASTKKRK